MKKTVVTDMLNPQAGLPPEARAILRTKLGLPAETVAAPVTNAVPKISAPVSTNALAPTQP